MVSRLRPADPDLARVIGTSASYEAAAAALGFGKTWCRKQAARLSVRPLFRLGVERLPCDAIMREKLRTARSAAALAKELGVVTERVLNRARELGVDPRRRVRDGLPDDTTLARDLWTCRSHAELADSYGVGVDTVRNQAKRLRIPVPSKRGSAPRPDPALLAPQPEISDRLGAAWIDARYDHGTMPEPAFRVIDATRPPSKRASPRTPTAFEAAFSRARSRGTHR